MPEREDPGHGQRRAHDRHADPGVAPEQLLVDDRERDPGRVGPELGDPLEAVEADLRGLLDDRPGRLLALVPLGRRRAHHVLREAVNPVPDVLLVLVQLHREVAGARAPGRPGTPRRRSALRSWIPSAAKCSISPKNRGKHGEIQGLSPTIECVMEPAPDDVSELESRQEPRLVRALEMVAPGTAVREGIEHILHAHTGALICIGDSDELSFLYSGGVKLEIDYTPAVALPAGQDGRRDHPFGERDQDPLGQRPADAGSDDRLARDRHPPPHRRARLEADRRARHRDLRRPLDRLALPRRRQVHPRGHPGRARQGQPGAGHARQVPQPPGPGLDAPDRARVRGRRHAARRAHGAAALGARHAHGGRDRALHRRARHRGPPDRDAARGGHGRRRRRARRARARLHGRGLRGGLRARPRLARATASPGPARLRPARRAARATTARSTRSTIRCPRAATGSSGASHACRSC